ncbi:MAG: DUF2345 domain-containing protein [Methylibium sp.]|uniref:DUF2345 domain-containing protein n=1 Tax=Methylibium sp. TaxID=2067992 RepID=UPI0017F68DD8|nr:DUF2345 domain-containing protein [Methylibium sp.]MBA3598068.1 DUF2345 domain-containing protein [Methylibium sp.]
MSGKTTSWYVHGSGIKAFAAHEPVSLRAHADALQLLADREVGVISAIRAPEDPAPRRCGADSGAGDVPHVRAAPVFRADIREGTEKLNYCSAVRTDNARVISRAFMAWCRGMVYGTYSSRSDGLCRRLHLKLNGKFKNGGSTSTDSGG